VGLYTELFYAIIPILFLFFADLLSLHLVTFLFLYIICSVTIKAPHI